METWDRIWKPGKGWPECLAYQKDCIENNLKHPGNYFQNVILI
jgi:hypothetical protein